MLNNIRVVELGQAFAGPFSAEILADLGAEVIKVERPGVGDDARKWGPPFWGDDAAVFHSINGNKTSLALDLKNEADLAACRALIGEADVLVHNMRPGAMDRMGLGVEELTREFPHLIYAEVSAYGAAGPMKDLPGYEILGQAFGGIMAITGEPDRAPVRSGPSLCDFGSGMWLAIGVLSALVERAQTGKGRVVQTSLFETALVWTTVAASGYLASGKEPKRVGATHHLVSPYGYFETRTGPIMIACANDALFKRLSDAIGHPEWVEDERFADSPSRIRNKAIIERLVAEVFMTADQDHWFDVLTEAGVPCSPVNTVSEALGHEQAKALGILQTDPDRPEVRRLGLPLSFDGTRPALKTGAPTLGSGSLDELLKR